MTSSGFHGSVFAAGFVSSAFTTHAGGLNNTAAHTPVRRMPATIHFRCFITPSIRPKRKLGTAVTHPLQAAQHSSIDADWESCTLVPTKPHRGPPMAKQEPIFTRETFRFFRDLARNNRKVWMDANRERYQEFVVKPFRRFLEELSPAVLRLDSRFDTAGRTGANFSRINRDIRFAKDKTPYRAQMYLKVSAPFSGETGQLYAGISADAVTAG